MRKFANRMWNSPHLGVPEKLCSVQCGISLWHDLHYYTVHSFPSLSEVTVFWVTVCKDSHAEWWLEHCLVYGPRHHPTYPHICAEVCIGMGKACIYLAHHWTVPPPEEGNSPGMHSRMYPKHTYMGSSCSLVFERCYTCCLASDFSEVASCKYL